MSKELFMELRAEQLANMYDQSFSKKEAKQTGVDFIKSIVEKGEVSIVDVASNIVRLNEVINAMSTEIKLHLPTEKIERFGVEFNFVSGRESLNFTDDDVYTEIKEKLKNREDLLKLAHKSKDEIYDSEGVQVPKVSSKQGKGYITAKF